MPFMHDVIRTVISKTSSLKCSKTGPKMLVYEMFIVVVYGCPIKSFVQFQTSKLYQKSTNKLLNCHNGHTVDGSELLQQLIGCCFSHYLPWIFLDWCVGRVQVLQCHPPRPSSSNFQPPLERNKRQYVEGKQKDIYVYIIRCWPTNFKNLSLALFCGAKNIETSKLFQKIPTPWQRPGMIHVESLRVSAKDLKG